MKSFETPFRCETVSWEEVIRVEKKTIILNHFPFGSLPDPATNRPIIQLHVHQINHGIISIISMMWV
mgnify:CR=1 FL=1